MRTTLLLSLLALSTLALGCNIMSLAQRKLTPPPKTPAKYKMGPDPAVVLVENFRNPAANEIDADQLAALITAQFETHKAAVMVDKAAVQQVRDENPGTYRQMSIPAIGRAAGAKQVVYVDIQKLTVETDIAGQMVRGQIEVFVRVVDAQTGQTRWPADVAEGWPIAFETPFTPIKQGMTESDLRRSMHDYIALNTVRLFRDWVAEYEAIDEKRAQQR